MTPSPYLDLLHGGDIVVQPVIYDALTARIAESTGFRAIGIGGYALGTSTGVSEPLLTLDEVAAATRRVTASCGLPVMVDGGAGYGEPLHVMQTIRVLAASGAAAVHIEDQAFPKRAHYHKGIEHVIPPEEMVAKIEGAVAARADRPLVIAARTDAVRVEGYESAVERGRLYVEAGADALVLFPRDLDEVRRAPRDLPDVPLIYVNSSGAADGRPLCRANDLENWGWSVVTEAIGLTNAIAQAARTALEAIYEHGGYQPDAADMVSLRGYVEQTLGLDEYYRIEARTVER